MKVIRSLVYGFKWLLLSLMEGISFINPVFVYKIYVYRFLKLRSKKGMDRLLDAKTKLVVDGFPRSGNSFLVRLLREYSDLETYELVHHHHNILILNAAIKRGLKVVVPVRNISDVSKSLAKFYGISKLLCRLRYAIYFSYLQVIKDKLIIIPFELIEKEKFDEIGNLLNVKLRHIDTDLIFEKIVDDAVIIHGTRNGVRAGVPEKKRGHE